MDLPAAPTLFLLFIAALAIVMLIEKFFFEK